MSLESEQMHGGEYLQFMAVAFIYLFIYVWL